MTKESILDMNQLISGELKIGNPVEILVSRFIGVGSYMISGIVTGLTDCINVVVFTDEDECYLGYRYTVSVGYKNTTVTVKYGNPMTLEQYKAYFRTPEAKANRLATYKSQPVVK
jgi:hypothetical protein